jgi:hypothetical protein
MTESSRSESIAPKPDEERELLYSWGLVGPTDEQVMAEAELLHVDQGDGSMLVWVRFPQNDAPPITAHPPPPRPADRPDGFTGWLTVPLGATETVHERRQAVGLPPQPFLYTLDQITQIINVQRRTLTKYLHFAGVTPGKCPKDKMLTANLSSVGETADWRVADAELIRWLRHKGFRVYDAWSLASDL